MAIVQAPYKVELSPTELLACWESLNLGEPPALFRLRRPGWTARDRAKADWLLRSALDDLAQQGLSDGSYPVPALTGMLRVIANADIHLDIRYGGADPSLRPILGVGAIAGEHGVIIVSNDGAGPIWLQPMDSFRVAGALLGLLGEEDVTAGRGRPVNVPHELLDRAAARVAEQNSFWALADELQACGVDQAEADSLARMCIDVDFGGQLGATARHGVAEVRGQWVVGFHRIAGGGYYMHLRRDGTVTICPADVSRLHQHWWELVSTLRPAQRW